MRRRVLLAIWIAAAGQAWAAEPQEPPPTLDEETGEQYNRFRDEFDKGVERILVTVARRYNLREEQNKTARRLAEEFAQAFLKEQGRKTFDLFQRMRSVREFMRDEKLTWPEVPEDIRQDLAERALPLIDAVENRISRLADVFADGLDPEQWERFRGDRERMSRGLRFARWQARVMSGREPPDAGPAGGGPPRGRRPGGRRSFAGTGLDRWERYVKAFIERHRLDEVQKVRATDLLKKYKARAELLLKKSEETAATQPTRRYASARGLRRWLDRLREQRRPMHELFEQLKAELDKIPTAVQRKLAEEDGPATGSPSSAPGRAGQEPQTSAR